MALSCRRASDSSLYQNCCETRPFKNIMGGSHVFTMLVQFGSRVGSGRRVVSAEENGSALMDNTTIHGAVAAYHQWPPSPAFWRSGLYAVNLRSLMDVIEAVVLFDRIMLDGACDSLEDPLAGRRADPGREWQPFRGLRDVYTGNRIFGLEQFSSQDSVLGGGILATAAERLQRSVADGLMQRQVGVFQDSGIELSVPRFYAGVANFAALTRESFSAKAISSVSKKLRELEAVISRQTPDVANFAMFAFRGYYYEELAHLLSMSYIPHSFRSGVLAEDGRADRGMFLRLALESAGDLRKSYIKELGPKISAQLNSELSAPPFRASLPLIATFVAAHANRRSELMPIALEIRNSASARRFRQWVSNVQSAIDEQARLQVIRNAREDLSDLCSDLRKELRLAHTPATEITMKLAVPTGAFAVDIPVSIRAGFPQWLKRVLHRRPHLRFLRDLALGGIEFAPFELRYSSLRE